MSCCFKKKQSMFQTPPRAQERFTFSKEIIRDEFDPSSAQIEVLDLSEWENSDKYAVVIHGLLTPEECAAIIEKTEDSGYEPALVNIFLYFVLSSVKFISQVNIGGGRQELMSDVRNNDRCIIDDALGADKLWGRVLQVLDTLPKGHKAQEVLTIPWASHRNQQYPVSLNERLRFLRYDKDTYFAPHNDGCYVRGNELGEERRGEQSFVTFQLYLNDGFEGGATRFSNWRSPQQGYDVVPRTGSVLMFQHDCYHEGAILLEGRKYAVRTDVMYTQRKRT